MSEQSFAVGELSELDRLMLKLGVAQRKRQQAQEHETQVRANAVEALGEGGRKFTYNPLNHKEKLWHSTVSETQYQAHVTDRAAAEAWVCEQYPFKTRTRKRLVPGTRMDEVIEALLKVAPYLVEDYVEVEDHVLHELEQKSKLARQPMGFGGEIGEHAPPGITVTKPKPSMRVTFEDGAAEAIDELILRGVIDDDGNVIARQQVA